MNEKVGNNELFQASHIVILVSYSVFSAILIAESLLLSWEGWALVLIAVGVFTAWILHLRQHLSANTRLWIYSLLMMATFFFYGTHETSTFDMAAIMAAVIMLYTMTGIKALVTLCQVTYILTFVYDISEMLMEGQVFDILESSRVLLHLALVIMVGVIARIIIDIWWKVLNRSHEEIEDLKDSTERLNDFLANVSHEIRTPVNAVIGMTRVCLEKEQDDEIKKDLESVMEAGRRVGEQIGDILDYSEIDRGNLATNNENYIFSSVINDIVTEIQPFIKREVELVIDVDASIPHVMKGDATKLKKIIRHLLTNGLKYTREGGVYMRVTANRRKYGLNLCIEVNDTGIGMDIEEKERIYEGFYQGDSSRARVGGGLGLGMAITSGFVASMGGFMTLKSAPGEGTSIRISLPQEIVDPEACMSVKDSDSLLLAAFLQYEKFSDPNVREYYNSLMKHICQGAGVRIHRVDSLDALKKLRTQMKITHLLIGEEEFDLDPEFMEDLARFTKVVVAANMGFKSPVKHSRVILMAKPVHSFRVIELLNTGPGEYKKVREKLMLPGVRALVVDDEPMNLAVAREVLSRYGMKVYTVESGYEAIDACRTNDYDVVFMDHMMPGMDGIEAMKRIRSDGGSEKKKMPIIAFTANAVSTAKEMFMNEGFNGFVSKPIVLSELERVMERELPEKVTYEQEDEEVPKRKSLTDHTKNPKSEVRDLKSCGVDVDAGVSFCGGDYEFYDELLSEFAIEASDNIKLIEKVYSDKNRGLYISLMYCVMDSARLICADRLAELARDLIEHLSVQDEVDNVMHKLTMLEYRNIRDIISAE